MGDVNTKAVEKTSTNSSLVGTYHRIAGVGPSYEVLSILDDKYASIMLLETGETVKYRLEDIRLDPHPDATCSHSPLTST